MEPIKDHYATLGVAPTASPADIKRAYRKLARRFHPDVSKEPDAENRFKTVAEAHEALIDPERRAAYDEQVLQQRQGGPFVSDRGAHAPPRGGRRSRAAPAGPAMGEEDLGALFESMFGGRRPPNAAPPRGEDQHAAVQIDLLDSYRGATRTVTLRTPLVGPDGRARLQEQRLEVRIPRGVRPGQKLRLKGQGGAAFEGDARGDLYLEIGFRDDPRFSVEGADVSMRLNVSPWEAALGAAVAAQTPEGPVELTVPAGSASGRRLRLKGRGLPGEPAGDLYATLQLVLPPATAGAALAAWQALAAAFADFDPRAPVVAGA